MFAPSTALQTAYPNISGYNFQTCNGKFILFCHSIYCRFPGMSLTIIIALPKEGISKRGASEDAAVSEQGSQRGRKYIQLHDITHRQIKAVQCVRTLPYRIINHD